MPPRPSRSSCLHSETWQQSRRQRVAAAARSVGYRGDVNQVGISTIHSLSGRILLAHQERAGLQPGYKVLNRETQRSFMTENFQTIFSSRQPGFKIYGWKNPQQIITKAARSFDLITEEDISPRRLWTRATISTN